MCKEYTASRNREDSRSYASIDADQEIGKVFDIGIATVIDVFGIEVQVPSLSSPGCSVWIVISRGHERIVNEIHRHNSDIVNYSFFCAHRKKTSTTCVLNLPNLQW